MAIRGGNIPLDAHYGVTKEELQTLKFQKGPYRVSRLWHMDISHARAPPEVESVVVWRAG